KPRSICKKTARTPPNLAKQQTPTALEHASCQMVVGSSRATIATGNGETLFRAACGLAEVEVDRARSFAGKFCRSMRCPVDEAAHYAPPSPKFHTGMPILRALPARFLETPEP